ncbi:MAG: hypothetical protein ABL999_08220 [Pyrinomonadaceae bacterium]
MRFKLLSCWNRREFITPQKLRRGKQGCMPLQSRYALDYNAISATKTSVISYLINEHVNV